MSEPLWQPRSDLAARLAGAAFILGGLGLLFLQIRALLNAATSGGPVVLFVAAVSFGALAVIMGLAWSMRGLAGYSATRQLRHDARRRSLLFLGAALLGGLTLIFVNTWLRSHGYAS